METLYDLLGALPRDDAEALRAAFRQAVKGAHPDLNPGDPDAGKKFRQIVRAQEILLDSEQRAAYDHLLELARVEEVKQTRAGKIHRLASWVMALAGASAVSIAGLAVVALLWTSTEPSAGTDLGADEPAPTKVAALPEPSSPASPSATSPSPAEAAPAAATVDDALPPLGPPLDITPPAAGEFERLHGFDRAFADISHARRPERGGHAMSLRKKGPVAAESTAVPMPPRRTAANDLSRQESAAFNPRP
ncbi:MAG TPA: J domain-containing protein [Bradyrhizobium sp.]|nr:J domain-containing protein [Bradyrhizobium sp.]